jgi:cardiolipin synthase
MPTPSEIMRPWAYLNWPNRITLLRLLLVAPFVILLQHQQQRPVYRYLALGVFAAMALSDAADGFLARRLNCKSRLGMILDPLADKTLIVCAAVLLSLPHSCVRDGYSLIKLPDWVVVLIIGKDLWVVVGFVVLFLLTGRIRVVPSKAGKACTVGQLAMVSALLLSPDLNRLGPGVGTHLARALWWIAALLSVAAAVGYTRMGLSFLAEAEPADSSSKKADKAA